MGSTELALVKKSTVDVVAGKVREFQESGQLHLPADYSPENAMKSAWLILQEIKTSKQDGYRPALEVCTRDSIANSLLDMVVQGLNPAKKQGYFIVYGKQLVFQRSYFGTMALVKRVDPTIEDILAEVVYEGDTFKYRINRGKKEVTEHEQSLDNVDSQKIKAAYCMIIDTNGEVKRTEIMTIDEIKAAWKQSIMKPIDENGNIRAGSTHEKFTAEMCKRTVINKACKPIINSSGDNHLFRESFNRASEVAAEEEVAREIATNANSEVIDVEATWKDEPAEEPWTEVPPEYDPAENTQEPPGEAPPF